MKQELKSTEDEFFCPEENIHDSSEFVNHLAAFNADPFTEALIQNNEISTSKL